MKRTETECEINEHKTGNAAKKEVYALAADADLRTKVERYAVCAS